MLVIRPEQMAVFERNATRRFEDEMVAHSKTFTPRLAEVIGEDQLRLAVRAAIRRAATYGFTLRGPIRLFIEVMFLWGSGFDSDPQYRSVGAALRADGDQMSRSQQIHGEVLHYLERVSGPGATNVHDALRALFEFAQQPTTVSLDELGRSLLAEMWRMFPAKAHYVGDAGLEELIRSGVDRSRQFGFTTPRQITLVVVLMFAFGHGCTDDPLYPWIARTLTDERIVSASARAERLETKARTWLEHVLARIGRRAGA